MYKVISGFLSDIAQEQNGFSIGNPWRFTEHSLAAVVPLIRVTDVESRPYRILAERKNEVKVSDTGHIDRVTVTNKGEFPILMKAGEVLVGGTQTRAITISQIVFPGEKLTVPCACVYSTKGIREGQRMSPDYYSPVRVRREVYKGHYGREGELRVGYLSRQEEVWGGVKSASKSMASGVESLASYMRATPPGSRRMPGNICSGFGAEVDIPIHYDTPSEDLAGRVEETQEKLKDILKSIPKVDHQVGIVLLTVSGLESMEAFEHPDSWEGLRRAVLGAEIAKIADISEGSPFEFKAEIAKDIIKGLLTKDFAEKVAVDRQRTQTYILDTDKFMGEVVLLDSNPIHCSFVRKDS